MGSSATDMERVLSGIQPTGDLHLGNYLGAIRQFVDLQKTADCLFCVVDLHAVTVKYDPRVLRFQTRQIAAAYLACGITAPIFVQSHVRAHTELAYLLSTIARMGWMERMTQFKDKTGENSERASLSLFAYPVLMAADILLYKATAVPVGADQLQHLELTRDIAKKFNNKFGEYFPLPKPLTAAASRIMSLQDASKKMSKSDVQPLSRINLTDTDDEIAKKVRKATADINAFPSSENEIPKAEIDNLITIYSAITGKSREAVFAEFGGKGYGVFKPALADALIATIEPIRYEMAHFPEDHLENILSEGAAHANEIAEVTIREVKFLMGF
jgi:tryptophanyl-tRNA synthetase